MENLAKYLRLRNSLTTHVDSCKIFLNSPGWHKDRVLAVDYKIDPENPWEYAEILLSEAFHDGGRRDYFFISLLEDSASPFSLEADFGAGKFRRGNQPGGIVFGDEQHVRMIKGIGPFHTSMIYVHKDVVQNYFTELTQSDKASPESLLVKSFRDDTLQVLVKQLIYHFRQPVQTGQAMVRQHLQDLILRRLVEVSHQKAPSVSEEDRLSKTGLKRVIDYMSTNFVQDLSLDSLALQAGVSRSQFVRLFRQSTGESPKQFLLRLRLQKAKELLAVEAKNLSILQIAQLCGFCDQSHLAREFRQVYGTTPAVFRRIHC